MDKSLIKLIKFFCLWKLLKLVYSQVFRILLIRNPPKKALVRREPNPQNCLQQYIKLTFNPVNKAQLICMWILYSSTDRLHQAWKNYAYTVQCTLYRPIIYPLNRLVLHNFTLLKFWKKQKNGPVGSMRKYLFPNFFKVFLQIWQQQ